MQRTHPRVRPDLGRYLIEIVVDFGLMLTDSAGLVTVDFGEASSPVAQLYAIIAAVTPALISQPKSTRQLRGV